MQYALSDYHYHLPEELIAQFPADKRDASRLMVVDRRKGTIDSLNFPDLCAYLSAGDRVIFNNTKVIPARLFGTRETGGVCEIFLVEKIAGDVWKVMSRPARKLKTGVKIRFSPTFSAEVIEELPEGMRLMSFTCEGDFESLLQAHGQLPLPQYIKREAPSGVDMERYQTLFAKHPGAVAAPTAGLHFSQEVLDRIGRMGAEKIEVTLHVGLGTFKPVLADDIRDHQIHTESYHITEEAAAALNYPVPGGRRICVGTTSCRTLESAAGDSGNVKAGSGRSSLFIYPGYRFKCVDALLTNFHLPQSSLLMLVCAFGGYDLMMEAYRRAIAERYRFYSYGDAMLIV